MEPIDIECISCGQVFEFTVYEQLLFSKKQFDEPKRCPDCRKRKLNVKGFIHNKSGRRKAFDWNQVVG